jgi:hypothetical protein
MKVLRRGLEVDMPEQPPGKKKSRWKCFVGFWRWTCQSKPPGRRNKAGSANPQEEEIRLKVLRRGLEVDMPQQTAGGFNFVAYQQANSVTPWSVGSQHKMKQMNGLEHDCSVCVLRRFVSVVVFQVPNRHLFLDGVNATKHFWYVVACLKLPFLGLGPVKPGLCSFLASHLGHPCATGRKFDENRTKAGCQHKGSM